MKNMTLGDVKLKDENGQDDGHSPLFQVMPSYSTPSDQHLASDDKDGESSHQPEKDLSSSSQKVQVGPSRIHHHIATDHPMDQIVGDINKGVQTRSRLATYSESYSFVSFMEPTRVQEALSDSDWICAMNEELDNFKRNEVWELVERPTNHNVIGTKWVFRNKQNENGAVIRNKARLVAQGYSQVEFEF